jgi:uncharacterized protein YjbI with pentapeptide repeats
MWRERKDLTMTFARSYALVIGIGSYQHAPRLNVPHTAQDAGSVGQVLQDPAYCAYPPDQVYLLHDADATRNGILTALDSMAARIAPEDTMLFLYSGHSDTGEDGEYYLTTHDTRLNENRKYVQGTGINPGILLQKMTAIRARRVLIVINTAWPDEAVHALLATGEGRIVITACGERQQSFIGQSSPLTIFGQAFVDGLRGHGQRSGKGLLNVYDLYAYLYDTVAAEVRRQVPEEYLNRYGVQEPQMSVLKGTGPFAIGIYHGEVEQQTRGTSEALPPGTAAREVAAEELLKPLEKASDNVEAHGADDVAAEPEAHSRESMADRRERKGRRDSYRASRDLYLGDRINAGESQGFVNRAESVSQVFGEQTINTGGGIYAQGNVYFSDVGPLSTPFQAPPPPEHYILRKTEEQNLCAALLDQNEGAPLTILWGTPGTGKSSLAAKVASDLTDEGALNGPVLWGSLADRKLEELVRDFLVALDRKHYGDAQGTPAEQQLWQTLIDRHTLQDERTLIVIDNVESSDQIVQLQPPARAHCRILAISMAPLDERALRCNRRLRLGPFEEPEALDLFGKILNSEWVDTHQATLGEIGQQLDFLPQLVASTALTFANGNILPASYLRQLRESGEKRGFLDSALQKALELTLHDLAPDQVVLLELIGVLGEGDWTASMLAAVALMPLSQVKRALHELVRRDLIAVVDNRYRSKTLIRDFARQRLQEKRDSYMFHAAFHLLARYCLDVAQDRGHRLTASAELRTAVPEDHSQDSFVRAFRDAIAGEITHIRRVLDWATANGVWDLLRRFSYLPYAGLARGLICSGMALRMDLRMATLETPIVRVDQRRLCAFELFIGNNLSVRDGHRPVFESTQESDIGEAFFSSTGADTTPPQRCELHLNIIAGYIDRGIFERVELVDAEWIGVRAPGALFREIDLVGCRLLACDLSRSLWVGCDARRVVLTDTDLSYALLKDVKLRGADLQRTDLTGAMLDNVDLRGADLRGANLTLVRMRNVDLRGAKIDSAQWAGAGGSIQIEEQLLTEIQREAARPQEASSINPYNHILAGAVLAGVNWVQKRLVQADLRAAELSEVDLTEARLNQSDLRAAELSEVDLTEARLNQSDLRAAELSEVKLTEAYLSEANLSASILDGVDLHNARLSKARLSAASLRRVSLTAAQLEQADLRFAHFSDSMLNDAVLTGAVLSYVLFERSSLQHANMAQARLVGAILIGANLANANLAHTDLSNADLAGVKLNGSNLEAANLARANLIDADLSNANLADANCRYTNFLRANVHELQLVRAGSLAGATLPDGTRVEILDGDFTQEGIGADRMLRFASMTGTFSQIDLDGRDLLGASLSGSFRATNLFCATLKYATLSGSFPEGRFVGADLGGAQLTGNFAGADLRGANLLDAVLTGDFLLADLSDAQNVTEVQLAQANRLRGAILPDGTRYDGRFRLTGDLSDARDRNVDIDDPTALAGFYAES